MIGYIGLLGSFHWLDLREENESLQSQYYSLQIKVYKSHKNQAGSTIFYTYFLFAPLFDVRKREWFRDTIKLT